MEQDSPKSRIPLLDRREEVLRDATEGGANAGIEHVIVIKQQDENWILENLSFLDLCVARNV